MAGDCTPARYEVLAAGDGKVVDERVVAAHASHLFDAQEAQVGSHERSHCRHLTSQMLNLGGRGITPGRGRQVPSGDQMVREVARHSAASERGQLGKSTVVSDRGTHVDADRLDGTLVALSQSI